ncbi:hypothetical protein H0A64_07060 [Alcaligenaceae bacterium]|nr:hypothetical protein [Alcaligenaceae bacterium]
MILTSTLRKLGDKPVFIVSVPAFTARLPETPPLALPAHRDVFATKAQAVKYAAQHDPRQYGATEFPVISRMSARAYADQFGWLSGAVLDQMGAV